MSAASTTESIGTADAPPFCADWRGTTGAMGVTLLALGLIRAYPDGIGVVEYLRDHSREILTAPERLNLTEFPGALWAIWPILIGLGLVVGRSPRLLRGAMLTSTAMGLERSATLVVGAILDSGWSWLYPQTLTFTPPRLLPRGLGLAMLFVTAVGSIVLGIASWRANARWRHMIRLQNARPDRRPAGRLATFGSWLFALGLIGSLGWVTYLEVLERLPWVRGLILKNDRRPSRPFFRRPPSPQAKRFYESTRLYNDGASLQYQGKYSEAIDAYAKALKRFESLVDEAPEDVEFRRQYSLAANNLAWFLVTCPDRTLHQPKTAVSIAKRAVALYPNDGNALNTLAVAHFRAGNLAAATEAFDRSMALRQGGDSFDWYVLAMIEQANGHPEKARAWFDKAVTWRADNRARDAELDRFETEAAESLGIPKPPPPAPIAPASGSSERIIQGPGGSRRMRGP